MSLTRKGSLWEFKNSLFVSLAFLPFVNSYAFYFMNNRVENKRWAREGTILLISQIVLFLYLLLVGMMKMPELDITNRPKIEDYLGYGYYEKYGSEYNTLPEYADYEQALEEWYKTPEIKKQLEEKKSARDFQESLSSAGSVIFVLFYFGGIFLVFIEKSKYLKALAKHDLSYETLKELRTENLKQETTYTNSSNNESIKDTKINEATKEELMDNLKLNIVDAIKVIDYREKKGAFTNNDEFFSCINAKPHIIAKLEDHIIIEKIENKNVDHKRRVDI